MIFFITLKDIAAFFRSEKKVFIWLLICMISGAFVLNYSYSFSRYTGAFYEDMWGDAVARYSINTSADTTSADMILKEISEEKFPDISSYQFFGKTEDGYSVIGSNLIGDMKGMGYLTGIWTEGYYNEIENTGDNVIAMNRHLLDYGDRLKMTGETVVFDGEEFIIKGVFGDPLTGKTDAMIFSDKFAEKYGKFDSFRITFAERLTDDQAQKLSKMIRDNIPNADIAYPPEPGEVSSELVKSYELICSAIIIMLVVCLVSLIKYWQAVNLPAYTVYWINGATSGTIMRVALCESLLLCASTFLAGLGINALLRGVLSSSAPLTLTDIGIGFLIFLGTFAVFTLINTAKICKQLKITNVRRD